VKTSSAKAKGRNAQKQVVKLLRTYYDLDLDMGDECYAGDIQSVPMGMSKEDIKLSPLAQKYIPFNIEVKAQEKLNVWSALKQAEENSVDTPRIPLLVFKRNRSKLYACLEFEELLRLIAR
jgi:hypothetical protein